MTLGVVEKQGSFLARMIALACESAGHDCLVFKDIGHAIRIIHAIRLDRIVIDLERPGLYAVDWLEIIGRYWPDLPPKTLLLAESEPAPGDAARIHKLGAEVVYTPSSLADAKHVVLARLHQARSAWTGSIEAS